MRKIVMISMLLASTATLSACQQSAKEEAATPAAENSMATPVADPAKTDTAPVAADGMKTPEPKPAAAEPIGKEQTGAEKVAPSR